MTTGTTDPMGLAIQRYYLRQGNAPIQVYSDAAEPEVIMPAYLFRSFEQMPRPEQLALQMAKGAVLDIGAGAGVHSLWLVEQGYTVTALDQADGAFQVLQQLPLHQAIQADIFQWRPRQSFDTILLLMNGIGLSGNLEGLQALLSRLYPMLSRGGSLWLDSTDLRPLLGPALTDPPIDEAGTYYGTITYQLEYADTLGMPFEWLFVDWPTLRAYAEEQGFHTKCPYYGTDFHYLAQLQKPYYSER